MKSDDLEQLLIGYGLTKNQSKVFSTLVNQNYALTAKQISSSSNLAEETVYRNLVALKEKGLIENSIGVPKKYVAIPLKTALLFLREQRNIRNRELEVLTTHVLIDYNKKRNKTDIKEKTQFLLVPKKKQLVTRISDAISNSKKIIKIITSWKRQIKALIVYESALNQALINGAKIQFLVTETPKDNKLPKYAEVFYNHPNTEFKFKDSPPEIVTIIIDDRELLWMTEPKATLGSSSALWSNNPSLITALSAYFDSIWIKAE